MSRQREKDEIQKKINENNKRAHLLDLKSQHYRLGEKIKKIEESQKKDDDETFNIILIMVVIAFLVYACSKSIK